jgi:hypothetical protein
LVSAAVSFLITFQNHITLSAHEHVPALASDDVTVIVEGATWITVASLTTIMVI